MRIAFYAPMKAPTDPIPSGDRKIARLLSRALRESGHDVQLASTFRSWEGRGDAIRQQRLQNVGCKLAQRLVRRYVLQPAAVRPQLWFTYHLYYKAPDWLGPAVTRALRIPYVAAEVSYAPKRATGPWGPGLTAAHDAIKQCDAVIALKSYDIPCLLPLLDNRERVIALKPFLDTRQYAVNGNATLSRTALARRYDLDANCTWLLAVAMMRPGNKLACYRLLARALCQISNRRLTLLIVGDGAARAEVEMAFNNVGKHRVVFAGIQSHEALKQFYAASDLFVWPAVNEPFGMALLEAQAAGLPVVAGRSRGVPDVVNDHITGILVEPGDVYAFADAVRSLLNSSSEMREMGVAARELALREHDIHAAGKILSRVLERVRSGKWP
ncbi:MAG: glycosyltransferase family 4 protein [Acidiferrobacterales bacterium]